MAQHGGHVLNMIITNNLYIIQQLRGFPAFINSKTQLVDTFTQMIWLVTGHHASVNYPMVDYVTYVPNLPLKLYDSRRVPNITFDPERLPNRKESAVSSCMTRSEKDNTLKIRVRSPLFGTCIVI